MSKQQKKTTILVVEDEVSVRNVLVDKLTHEGFLALQAKNGEEGLQMAMDMHPAVILLDIVMPRMDGITMLKQLRSTDEGKRIPVIILTNLSDTPAVEDAMKQGVYDFLVKSDWRLDDVVAKVKERLAR